jgi:hypothetical protein
MMDSRDWVDTDVIHSTTLREVQETGLNIIQLVMGIIQKPALNAHYITRIELEVQNLERVLKDAGFEGDDTEPGGIALAGQPMTFSDMAFATAMTGIQELSEELFGGLED